MRRRDPRTPSSTTPILLIDSATSGCAGAYIDRIHRSLVDKESIEVGVSYYFPFDYGRRIFYKYSELAAQRRYRLGRARLYVRLAELIVAFARLLVYARRREVRLVCYALSSNLLVEYLFLWAMKHLVGARVYLICHDVVPFLSPGEDLAAKMRKRKKFYALADRLVVHNDNSRRELRDEFGVEPRRVLQFPFPLYDLGRIGVRTVDVLPPTRRKRFLFIGHLRAEKGIDLLLKAWQRFIELRDAELVIAGNLPAGCIYDFELAERLGVTLMPGYLTDEQYTNLIRQADCVVLPYLRGTNSAVVSTALSLRRNLIASDIDMFSNNPLIPPASLFRAGDVESLTDRLAYFVDLADSDQHLMDADLTSRLEEYDKVFREQVNVVFDASGLE